jgi:glycosyltransferase involved in cell wall biosynthesis
MSGANDAPPRTRVAVAVATRRRPDGLARLLDSLSRLNRPEGTVVEVVVVENDDPHERPLPPCALPARRVFEPRQGIPIARNRAIDEAAPSADWIVFLDDDETVEPSIVARLLAAARATSSPIATGPALPRFEPGSAAWAARSGAYEPVRHAHLARVPYAFTNNVLFDARIVRVEGAPRLDERMLHTGGSDREFFARLAGEGHAIVWADDAVAYEWYPPARATYRWLFQRSLRLGTVAPATESMFVASAGSEGASRRLPPGKRLVLCWRAARFAARAVVRTVRTIADPPSALALASWDLGRSAGLVLAALGFAYEEYRSR